MLEALPSVSKSPMAGKPRVNPPQYRFLKRLEAEMHPPVTTVLGLEQPPHLADVGDDSHVGTPLDELWSIKHRIDLVRWIT